MTYAASRSLEVLEQRRQYINLWYCQPQMRDERGKPDMPVVDLPYAEEVLEVARADNLAVEQGTWGVRGHVMAATGLTEATTRRRINPVREQGLIPKETK